MPYKIVNRHKGFIVLPDGQKLEKQSSTKIDVVTPEFSRMEQKGLISIHFLIEPRKTTLDGWESLLDSDIIKPQFPVPLHEGAILMAGGEKFIWENGKWETKGFALGRVILHELSDEPTLMIEVTGIDIVKFGKDVFELSPVTGKAMFVSNTNSELSSEEVMACVYPTGDVVLKMDKIKGRDCRMSIYRQGDILLIETTWINHTMGSFVELLRRHGII